MHQVNQAYAPHDRDRQVRGHQAMLRAAHIIGWGMYVPERIMLNDEFKELVNVDDDWIYPRTGIHARRVAAYGETTTQLAIRAAQQALLAAGVLPREVDYVLVATSTPEFTFPSTACMVQDAIGAVNAGANDIAAACSGFMYALDLAANKIRTGSVNTALVIGAETMTRVMDYTDRKTCVLFGDGAGALVLRGSEAQEDPGGVLYSRLYSDGTGWDLLTLPSVGSQETYCADGQHALHKMVMDGRCVFQFATQALATGISTAAAAVGLTPHDLDLIVPHQANQRIIDTAATTLGISRDKFFCNLEQYGNTSAASIPIALTEAANSGRLKPGDLVGLVGFGGGLSSGVAIVTWGGPQAAVPQALQALQWSRRQQQTAQAAVRRFWRRYYWRWMVYHSPEVTLRRWRRKLRAAFAGS